MALHQSTGRLSRAVRNSDIADSYDAKWLQLSRRAFLPDHSGKWALFYYNLKKILIIYQAEIFKFFYITGRGDHRMNVSSPVSERP